MKKDRCEKEGTTLNYSPSIGKHMMDEQESKYSNQTKDLQINYKACAKI